MSADIDLTRAQWVRSSYSDASGGDCVEFSRTFAQSGWVRSSYSDGSGGQCVEFSPAFARSGVVPVRDSKAPDGPALVFAADGWSGFVSAVKRGELPA